MDIFAKTEGGKTIGSALMAYGPALASRVFDPPLEAESRAADAQRSETGLRDIASKLELILQELQQQRAAAAPHVWRSRPTSWKTTATSSASASSASA